MIGTKKNPNLVSDHRFQHLAVKVEICHRRFSRAFFIIDRLQTLCLVDAHATVLALLSVDSGIAHPVFGSQIHYLPTGFRLLQDSDDLLFIESAPSSSLRSIASSTSPTPQNPKYGGVSEEQLRQLRLYLRIIAHGLSRHVAAVESRRRFSVFIVAIHKRSRGTYKFNDRIFNS